jgi:GntR family transcriptional repressor for pyruvate dehydrogenase complex
MEKLENITLNPVSRSRLHEEIVSQIQRKILSGELPAGEKLPTERDLALSLGVNRATVREALKKLEMLDLVAINHGDGIYVKDFLESGNLEVLRSLIYREDGMDPGMIKSILDIRNILGPEMAAQAAKNRGEADVAKLKAIVEKGEDLPALEADLGVHHAIARAAGNFLNVFILNFFNQLFRDYGHLYFDDPANAARSRRFHREIYEAIKDGDEKLARKIMRDVLEYAGRRTMEALGR